MYYLARRIINKEQDMLWMDLEVKRTRFASQVYCINLQKGGNMRQMSVTGMLKTMIPISRFNKGEANKIFDEVETTGTKIVVKNNKPACVLISPAQYESLMEMLSDFILREEAEARMEQQDDSENRTQEQMMQEFGITQGELDAVDVELE